MSSLRASTVGSKEVQTVRTQAELKREWERQHGYGAARMADDLRPTPALDALVQARGYTGVRLADTRTAARASTSRMATPAQVKRVHAGFVRCLVQQSLLLTDDPIERAVRRAYVEVLANIERYG